MSHTLWIFVAVASALKGVGEDTCNTDCEQRKLLAINAYDKGSRDLVETADPGANSDNLGNLAKSAELRSALVEDAAPEAAAELQSRIRAINELIEDIEKRQSAGSEVDSDEDNLANLLAMKAILEQDAIQGQKEPTQDNVTAVLAAMQKATNQAQNLQNFVFESNIVLHGVSNKLESELPSEVKRRTRGLLEEVRAMESGGWGPWPPATNFKANNMMASANNLSVKIDRMSREIESLKKGIQAATRLDFEQAYKALNKKGGHDMGTEVHGPSVTGFAGETAAIGRQEGTRVYGM